MQTQKEKMFSAQLCKQKKAGFKSWLHIDKKSLVFAIISVICVAGHFIPFILSAITNIPYDKIAIVNAEVIDSLSTGEQALVLLYAILPTLSLLFAFLCKGLIGAMITVIDVILWAVFFFVFKINTDADAAAIFGIMAVISVYLPLSIMFCKFKKYSLKKTLLVVFLPLIVLITASVFLSLLPLIVVFGAALVQWSMIPFLAFLPQDSYYSTVTQAKGRFEERGGSYYFVPEYGGEKRCSSYNEYTGKCVIDGEEFVIKND